MFGGDQQRPNLHIQDYCDAVKLFLTAPTAKIQNEIFNVGTQNLTIMQIAHLVRDVVSKEFPEKGHVDIITTPSDDNRSYHINSDKIKRVLGSVPWQHYRGCRAAICASHSAKNASPDSMTTTTVISTCDA